MWACRQVEGPDAHPRANTGCSPVTLPGGRFTALGCSLLVREEKTLAHSPARLLSIPTLQSCPTESPPELKAGVEGCQHPQRGAASPTWRPRGPGPPVRWQESWTEGLWVWSPRLGCLPLLQLPDDVYRNCRMSCVMVKDLSNFQCCSVGQQTTSRQEPAPERSVENWQWQTLGSSDLLCRCGGHWV